MLLPSFFLSSFSASFMSPQFCLFGTNQYCLGLVYPKKFLDFCSSRLAKSAHKTAVAILCSFPSVSLASSKILCTPLLLKAKPNTRFPNSKQQCTISLQIHNGRIDD
ncbi:hypothetical protein PIB30_041753 [Stylosanthes scabra]|uniref:Secreted protein n=1 Tax=Stylosanthes scabra TaxID=79078 RepID=A0ABU6RF40_9FABA|nr:hypothetical protein [Stylosanthes scabra]